MKDVSARVSHTGGAKVFSTLDTSHERLPAYKPGAAPARPSGPNRSGLLQSSGNPDVHDGLANTTVAAVNSPDSKSTDVLASSYEGLPASTPEGVSCAPFARARRSVRRSISV